MLTSLPLYSDFEEWFSSDKEFSGMFFSCVAAPGICPLARGNATATELEQAVWDLIETVKYHPIPLGSKECPIILWYILLAVYNSRWNF